MIRLSKPEDRDNPASKETRLTGMGRARPNRYSVDVDYVDDSKLVGAHMGYIRMEACGH